MKTHQVWITLEEWDGDTRICDTEMELLGTLQDADDARQLYDATVAHGRIVKDNLPIKV